jgi:hypothetical protein
MIWERAAHGFSAEGMDPATADQQPYRQVRDAIAVAFQNILTAAARSQITTHSPDADQDESRRRAIGWPASWGWTTFDDQDPP